MGAPLHAAATAAHACRGKGDAASSGLDTSAHPPALPYPCFIGAAGVGAIAGIVLALAVAAAVAGGVIYWRRRRAAADAAAAGEQLLATRFKKFSGGWAALGGSCGVFGTKQAALSAVRLGALLRGGTGRCNRSTCMCTCSQSRHYSAMTSMAGNVFSSHRCRH